MPTSVLEEYHSALFGEAMSVTSQLQGPRRELHTAMKPGFSLDFRSADSLRLGDQTSEIPMRLRTSTTARAAAASKAATTSIAKIGPSSPSPDE